MIMKSRHAIDGNEIRRLYLDERWTIEEISERFGCGASTISRRMEELGVAKRSTGPDLNRKEFSCEWSAELACVVGLIATDGNLSSDGRHMTIVSADYDLLIMFTSACTSLSFPPVFLFSNGYNKPLNDLLLLMAASFNERFAWGARQCIC